MMFNLILSLVISFSYSSNLPLEHPAVSAEGFQKLHRFLFKNSDPGMKTEGIVIYKDNEILHEQYTVGGPQTRHLMWSMSKTVTSLLFGIAQDKGFINKDESLYKYYQSEIDSMPEPRRSHFKSITLRNLLNMSSGLEWNEFYENAPFKSHVVRMIYFETFKDTAKYVLKRSIRSKPGEFFYYSSGDTQLLMGALMRAIPKKLHPNFPWKWLFEPMDLDAIFERDAAGQFMGASYLYLKGKDLIKLGELVLNEGVYKGKRLISQSYMHFLTQIAPAFAIECNYSRKKSYGAQIWLNKPCPGKSTPPMKDVPKNLVMFHGHAGQSIFIFPSQRIIVVRVAHDKMNALDHEKYAKLILGSFK